MTTKTTKRFPALVAVTTALAIATAAPSAFAGFVDVLLTQVEWPGFLMVQSAGINYQAQLNSPGCNLPANSIDTLKIWQSLATSALLAGKPVRVYYNDCNGVHWIGDIVLKSQ
jgi:hypothetical protein